MGISIQTIVIQQLQTASKERAAAREEREALRDQHLDELEKKADTEFEANNLQIHVNTSKALASGISAPFGPIGTVASSVASIVIDETDGRKVANLQRNAGLIERDAAAFQHEMETQKETADARAEEAKQTYQAGVDVLERRADLSRLA